MLRKRAAVDTPSAPPSNGSPAKASPRRRTLFTPPNKPIEKPVKNVVESSPEDSLNESNNKTITPLASPVATSTSFDNDLAPTPPAQAAGGRRKTIFGEYASSFSSTRVSSAAGRRTIFDISQDILAQRLQNANRAAAAAAAAAAKERSYSERDVADSFEELVALGSESSTQLQTPRNQNRNNNNDSTTVDSDLMTLVKKRKLYTPPHMTPIARNNTVKVVQSGSMETIVLDVSHDSSFDVVKIDDDDDNGDDDDVAAGPIMTDVAMPEAATKTDRAAAAMTETNVRREDEIPAKKMRLMKKGEGAKMSSSSSSSTPLRSTRRRTMIFNM